MPNIIKDTLLSILPPGAAWTPKVDGDFDKLLSGISVNYEELRLFLKKIASIRDPEKTDILSDLEKEFGIIPWSGLSEAERREWLAYNKQHLRSDGTADSLEERLQAAGFDCIVVENDPPVCTEQFIGDQYQTFCLDVNGICGDENAFCLYTDTRYIVNADSYLNPFEEYSCPTGDDFYLSRMIFFIAQSVDFAPEYSTYFLGESAFCGDEFAYCSEDTTIEDNEVVKLYPFPVPEERKTELERIILTAKPLHSWAVVSASFI